MLNFTQGTVSGNPFWDKVRDFLSTPTEEEIACQEPKPILFNTGDMEKPYPWDPTILPLQIFRIGNLFICAPPSEFTTMSGRRLRDAIKNVIRESGIIAADQEIYVTIAGLSNSYSSYVTTFEEYQAQRYEAASTLFGPNTLAGYIQEFTRLTNDLITGQPSSTSAPPPDLTDVQISLHAPGTPFDRTPVGTKFGDVVEGKDVLSQYEVTAGDSKAVSVSVTFHSANPRNNHRTQGTYLTVEKKVVHAVKSQWEVVAVDGDWETKFHWVSGKEDPLDLGLVAQSVATVTWDMPSSVAAGTYRVCHQGTYKSIGEEHKLVDFSGCSSEFSVIVN